MCRVYLHENYHCSIFLSTAQWNLGTKTERQQTVVAGRGGVDYVNQQREKPWDATSRRPRKLQLICTPPRCNSSKAKEIYNLFIRLQDAGSPKRSRMWLEYLPCGGPTALTNILENAQVASFSALCILIRKSAHRSASFALNLRNCFLFIFFLLFFFFFFSRLVRCRSNFVLMRCRSKSLSMSAEATHSRSSVISVNDSRPVTACPRIPAPTFKDDFPWRGVFCRSPMSCVVERCCQHASSFKTEEVLNLDWLCSTSDSIYLFL